MGTRADFYVGLGPKQRWVGSIAYDGHLENFLSWAKIRTAVEFRKRVNSLSKRDDFTHPRQGWPWPWNDSWTTDCAYAYHRGKVWVALDGSWVALNSLGPIVDFPDMMSKKKVTYGSRSGLLMIGGSR